MPARLPAPLHRAALVSAGLAAVIGILTLWPGNDAPPGPSGVDKIAHFAAFAALAFPVARARPGAFWPVVLAAVAYGGAIEIVQPLVDRGRELGDLIADGAGALAGAGLGARLGADRRR